MRAIQRVPVQDTWMLEQLQQIGFKSAIIAGGAIRDAYFKRKPKDVDIYLWHTKSSTEDPQIKTLEDMATYLGTSALKDLSTQSAENSMAGRSTNLIHSVYAAERNGRRYEFIFVKCPPKTYVREYFDVGICKCWYDGNRVHYTHDFMYDATNRTLSIVGRMNAQELYNTLNNHLRRLQEKFPHHDVRIDPSKVTK